MDIFPSVFVMEALAAARAASEPSSVVAFWRDAGKARWFAKDPAFDRHFRAAFLELHEAAAVGELDDWQATAEGALALLILLDQFPRNAFRGTPRMYVTDARARKVADAAIRARHDLAIEPELRLFMYLPFAHSEDLADQERSLQLCRGLGARDIANAQRHRDIVWRFGRFPHRNEILGRSPRAEELLYLAEGGYAG